MPESKLDLPHEFLDFLAAGIALSYDPKECDCGRVTLLRPQELKVQPFTILTSEMQFVYGDPQNGKGSYIVPAVDLVATCEHYDPAGILVWIPEDRVFGSWDCDHFVMNVLVARHARDDSLFIEAADWADIVAAPAQYLSAQWGRDATISKVLVPWPKYRWVAHFP